MKKPKFNRQFKAKDLAAKEDRQDESDATEGPDMTVEAAKPAGRSSVGGRTPLLLVDGDKTKEIYLPQSFTRHGFHHVVRWVAFLALVVLDGSLIYASVATHLNPAAVPMALGKELLGFALIFVANFGVLPSIVLEANNVECRDDKLIIRNLLYKAEIDWNDIKSISNPIFLKFAIVKTNKLFHLLNKRDIGRFYELLQILYAKTGLSSN